MDTQGMFGEIKTNFESLIIFKFSFVKKRRTDFEL